MIILAAGYAEPGTVSSHWARGYLNFALEAGILERGEITDLDVSMSRILTAKVSARALGVTRQDAQQKFTDTNDDCVQALSEIGIIGGYPDGTFRPSGSLTRAELSAIVSRIYAYRLDRNGGSTDNPDDPEDLDSDEPIEPAHHGRRRRVHQGARGLHREGVLGLSAVFHRLRQLLRKRRVPRRYQRKAGGQAASQAAAGL